MKNISKIVSLGLLCTLAASAPMQAGIRDFCRSTWNSFTTNTGSCLSNVPSLDDAKSMITTKASEVWRSELAGDFKRDGQRAISALKGLVSGGIALSGVGLGLRGIYTAGPALKELCINFFRYKNWIQGQDAHDDSYGKNIWNKVYKMIWHQEYNKELYWSQMKQNGKDLIIPASCVLAGYVLVRVGCWGFKKTFKSNSAIPRQGDDEDDEEEESNAGSEGDGNTGDPS